MAKAASTATREAILQAGGSQDDAKDIAAAAAVAVFAVSPHKAPSAAARAVSAAGGGNAIATAVAAGVAAAAVGWNFQKVQAISGAAAKTFKAGNNGTAKVIAARVAAAVMGQGSRYPAVEAAAAAADACVAGFNAQERLARAVDAAAAAADTCATADAAAIDAAADAAGAREVASAVAVDAAAKTAAAVTADANAKAADAAAAAAADAAVDGPATEAAAADAAAKTAATVAADANAKAAVAAANAAGVDAAAKAAAADATAKAAAADAATKTAGMAAAETNAAAAEAAAQAAAHAGFTLAGNDHPYNKASYAAMAAARAFVNRKADDKAAAIKAASRALIPFHDELRWGDVDAAVAAAAASASADADCAPPAPVLSETFGGAAEHFEKMPDSHEQTKDKLRTILEMDTFLAGFLLFSLTGRKDSDAQEVTDSETCQIVVQTFAFGVFLSATILTGMCTFGPSGRYALTRGDLVVPLVLSSIGFLLLLVSVASAIHIELGGGFYSNDKNHTWYWISVGVGLASSLAAVAYGVYSHLEGHKYQWKFSPRCTRCRRVPIVHTRCCCARGRCCGGSGEGELIVVAAPARANYR